MKHALFLSLLCAILLTCNPMSEVNSDLPCSGNHSKKISGICHGENNLTPETSCSDAQCHGTGLTGGTAGGLSCYSCHGEYWLVYANHSLSIFGTRHWKDMCTSINFTTDCGSLYCHTNTLAGSSSYMKSPGCGKCHAIPTADGSNCDISSAHTIDKNTALHHSDVCSNLDTCSTAVCHGTNYYGGTTGPFPGKSCITCHAGSATKVSNCWITGSHSSIKNGVHHHADVCSDLTTCSTASCHGTDYHGGTAGPIPAKSCLRCHAGSATKISNCWIAGTHTDNRDGVPHRPGSSSVCATTSCHGTNLRGGTTGPIPGRSCSRSGCHDGTPGDED